MIENYSKSLKKSVAALSMLCASSLCLADVFEVAISDTYQAQDFYPGLNLNDVNGVTMVTKPFDNDNREPALKQVKIDFANASDLVVNNISLGNDGVYRGVVNGAWVYRTVAVEINSPRPSELADGAQFDAVIRIVENTSLVNASQSTGSEIARIGGVLRDVTPNNKTVDRASVNVNGNRLTMNLKQRCVANPMDGKRGFLIDASWMGNGDRDLYITDLDITSQQCMFKAVALDVAPDPGIEGQHVVQLTYEDASGEQRMTTTPMSLDSLLQQGYNNI